MVRYENPAVLWRRAGLAQPKMQVCLHSFLVFLASCFFSIVCLSVRLLRRLAKAIAPTRQASTRNISIFFIVVVLEIEVTTISEPENEFFDERGRKPDVMGEHWSPDLGGDALYLQ